jgi:DNA-binding PadR family transcriptional regulator
MSEWTNSELAIIGLAAEGLGYGYQMEQAIKARGMREWTEIGFSSIYYALNRMEQAGWLCSQRTEGRGKPGRRIYTLTSAGLEKYRAEVLERLANDRPHTGDFDLALANLPALEPDGRAEVAGALAERRRRLAEKIVEVEAKWEATGRGHIPYFVDAVFDHGLAAMRAELTWLDQFGKNISQNTQNTQKRK